MLRVGLFDRWYNRSYTVVVKTAVSLPDSVFSRAERIAKLKGISRSELYRIALEAYLRQEELITEQLDAVYPAEESSVDPVLEEMQYRTLKERDEKG